MICIQRHYRGYLARRGLSDALASLDSTRHMLEVEGAGEPADSLEFQAAWQRQLYSWVEEGNNVVNSAVKIAVILLIIVATAGFVLETVPEYRRPAKRMSPNPFSLLESICIIMFTVEIAAKIACQPLLEGSYVRAVLNWFKQGMNIIDLIAILPWYLELILGGGAGALAVLRSVRLVRVFRIFKLGRYNTSAQLFKNALWRSAQPLSLLFYFMFIANILFASAMYYVEELGEDVNPGDDDGLPAAPFDSIPRAMYWCMVTMTTVGYGDMYPITLFGRMLAVMTMLAGIVVIALPITLIGSNFVDEYRRSQAAELRERKRKEANERAIVAMRVGQTLRAFMTTDSKGMAAAGAKNSKISYAMLSGSGRNVLSDATDRFADLELEEKMADLKGGLSRDGGRTEQVLRTPQKELLKSPSMQTPGKGGAGERGMMLSPLEPGGRIGFLSPLQRLASARKQGEKSSVGMEMEDDGGETGGISAPWDVSSPTESRKDILDVSELNDKLESIENRMIAIERVLVKVARAHEVPGGRTQTPVSNRL